MKNFSLVIIFSCPIIFIFTDKKRFAISTYKGFVRPLKNMPVNSREALEWATLGNAKALLLDNKIGSLTPGKKADIIMLRANDTNLYPVHEPVFAITDLANGSNVENVIIDGEFRKRHGKRLYPKKSYEKLRRELLVSANRLMEESNYHPSAA